MTYVALVRSCPYNGWPFVKNLRAALADHTARVRYASSRLTNQSRNRWVPGSSLAAPDAVFLPPERYRLTWREAAKTGAKHPRTELFLCHFLGVSHAQS